MTAEALLQAGKLGEAIQAQSAEVRNHPVDTRRRTFLFELLCLAGEFERAEKHLSILAQANTDAEMGALLYRSALRAERQRAAMFEENALPAAEAARAFGPGKLNGRRFESLEDLHPRLGARLELFVAGEYVWLPFEHVGSLRIEAPRLLRDTLWTSAAIVAGARLKGQDFGEALIPALYPASYRHPSEAVRLGRTTEIGMLGNEEAPFGQRMLLLDGEELVPFLEIRELTFEAAEEPAAAASQ